MISKSKYFSVEAKGNQLYEIYAMRYRSYSSEGYIEENPKKILIDKYDAFANNFSYLTYSNNTPIGSIRASLYDPKLNSKVPAMETFAEEIGKNCDLNKPFLEANKFVIEPKFQRFGGVRARFNIFKNIAQKAIDIKAANLIAAVRPEHLSFYKALGFYPVSKIKNYPNLKFKTILLVNEDLKCFIKKIFNKS